MDGLVLWVCLILPLSREQQGSVFLDGSETICRPNVVSRCSCSGSRLGTFRLNHPRPSHKREEANGVWTTSRLSQVAPPILQTKWRPTYYYGTHRISTFCHCSSARGRAHQVLFLGINSDYHQDHCHRTPSTITTGEAAPMSASL
jgi:hypothetical protein